MYGLQAQQSPRLWLPDHELKDVNPTITWQYTRINGFAWLSNRKKIWQLQQRNAIVSQLYAGE